MSDQSKSTGELFVPDPESFVPEADQRELAKPTAHEREIHDKIQKGLADARKTPEYAEEGRELTQPKPTGEWTPETVQEMCKLALSGYDSETIADAHNAALAAAKAGGWLSNEALDEYAKVEQEVLQLREQLAAEREKVQVLVDALEWYAEGLESSRAIAALAKVKEGK